MRDPDANDGNLENHNTGCYIHGRDSESYGGTHRVAPEVEAELKA
jgi:hypothetical protein